MFDDEVLQWGERCGWSRVPSVQLLSVSGVDSELANHTRVRPGLQWTLEPLEPLGA